VRPKSFHDSNPPPENIPDHNDHTVTLHEKPTTESREGPQDDSSRSVLRYFPSVGNQVFEVNKLWNPSPHQQRATQPLNKSWNHSPYQQHATQPFKVPRVIPYHSSRRYSLSTRKQVLKLINRGIPGPSSLPSS